MKETLAQLIAQSLWPVYLNIIDQSKDHAGHRHASRDGGTHFHIQIVSDAFDGLLPIKRHRLVYDCLAGPLAQGVHALSLETLTVEQAVQKRIINAARKDGVANV